MTIRTHILMAVLLAAATAAACSGKKKSTLPDETGDSDMSAAPPSRGDGGGGGGVMVPPDTMDEIQRRFDRKRPTVSRCLSAAIDAKELPKNSRGKITLNVTVMPGGKAGEIKVVKATIESERLTSCVISKVKEIVFPDVPKPYPTSYTYAFEAT
jgi:hypothetical protein